jgi:hypothetical protein
MRETESAAAEMAPARTQLTAEPPGNPLLGIAGVFRQPSYDIADTRSKASNPGCSLARGFVLTGQSPGLRPIVDLPAGVLAVIAQLDATVLRAVRVWHAAQPQAPQPCAATAHNDLGLAAGPRSDERANASRYFAKRSAVDNTRSNPAGWLAQRGTDELVAWLLVWQLPSTVKKAIAHAGSSPVRDPTRPILLRLFSICEQSRRLPY